MNNSLLETARRNRTAALEGLRIKKRVQDYTGQILCLKTMRDKMETKPLFTTVRVHRFEERRAA